MPTLYQLQFIAGSCEAISGTKEELIAELQNLIERIEQIDEEDYRYSDSVPLYDRSENDFILATIDIE